MKLLRPVVALSALACPIASGCGILWGAAQEQVEEEVRQQAGPGVIPPEPPVVPSDPIKVNSVLPNRGEIGGGLFVEIVGENFADGAKVLFGDVEAQASDTAVITANRIQTYTPQAPVGVVTVKVIIPGVGAGELPGGFEYYEPVTLTSLAPIRGPTFGGTRVMLEGTGFVSGTEVRFGGTESLRATVIDSTRAEVTTPRLPHAVYDVTAFNPNGAATLTAAFLAFEPVRVVSVVPFVGSVDGGTAVSVLGTGFIEPNTLTFGAQTLAATADAAQVTLRAATLPAVPYAEGAVDVAVTNESGTGRLQNGFTFVDFGVLTHRLIGVSPAVGLIDGGNTVHISGVGFDDPTTTVYFSSTAASCTVLSDNMIDCIAPPHAEGEVNVRVTTSGMNETRVNAYTYIELRLDALVPDRGAVAGGTYAILYGNGYGGEFDLFIDDAPARDLTILDAHRVAFRTPPGRVGEADVRVLRDGIEMSAARLFTYFDPYDSDNWSSGGAVNGAINATVIDNDGPVEGAFVMLGTDATTAYQGFTNPEGQITLSGPDVIGPQTVTAAKATHVSFTWDDVNAQNLTLWIPTSPPMSMGPQTCGAHPPVVRGKVTRIKDEFNYGNDYVLLTTTYVNFSTPLPDPGPKSQLINQGDYELFARTGDMVVVALTGLGDNQGHLKLAAMGFYPFLFTELGSNTDCSTDSDCLSGEICYDFGTKMTCSGAGGCCVSNDNCNVYAGETCSVQAPDKACTRLYDHVDIVVDTGLKQQMQIELDDPPLLQDPFELYYFPDTASAFVWYDFGYMGLLPMPNLTVPDTATLFMPMPEVLPGPLAGTPFNLVAGVYLGYDGDLDPSTPPDLYPPQSEVYLHSLVDTTRPIFATPVLGTQREILPSLLGFVYDPMHFEFSVNRDVAPMANLHAFYFDTGLLPVQTWLVISAGGDRSFDLPVLPDIAADARSPSGQYYWQMMAMYSPGAAFNRLNPNVLFDWRSQAVYLSLFDIP